MTKTKEIIIENLPYLLVRIERGSREFKLKDNTIYYKIPYKDIYTDVELKLINYIDRIEAIAGKAITSYWDIPMDETLICKLYE